MVDLIEIDAASHTQVDHIRDLIEKIQFAPVIAKSKVYIIDEVHMLSKSAFNALLKTLEEPPEHAYFILATTELHKVPDTVQSRCQRFPFKQVGDEDIIRRLQNIADNEKITVDRGALRAMARHVNGGMRDAISLLDQLSSLEKITEEDVRVRIGESVEEEVVRVWDALDSQDRQEVLSVVSALQEKGVSLEVFLRQLLTHARNEMHTAIEEGAETATSLERIDAIFKALKDLRVSPVPSVALEVALVELCMGEGDVVTKKKKVEKKAKKESKETREKEEVKEEVAKTEAVEETSEDAEEEAKAEFTAEELTLEALEGAWQEIIKSLKTSSVRMSLKDATISSFDGKELTLAFSSSFHKEKVEDAAAKHEVEGAIKEKFHQVPTIKCVLADEDAKPNTSDDGEEVNVVDAVAEIFGK